MAEGVFPKVDGEILYGSEVNSFRNKIIQLYTGTDLNNGSGIVSHELDATTFGTTKPDYLKIGINGTFYAQCTTENTSSSVSLKIEVKDIGGTYVEVFNRTICSQSKSNGSSYSPSSERVQFVGYLHTLTDDEKANGYQIQLTTTVSEYSGSASFSNDQIMVEQLS